MERPVKNLPSPYDMSFILSGIIRVRYDTTGTSIRYTYKRINQKHPHKGTRSLLYLYCARVHSISARLSLMNLEPILDRNSTLNRKFQLT